MADEGYYQDDYYDDYYGTYDQGGEPAEETWESNIEIKYDDAKSLLEYNTPECVRLMQEVLSEDEAKGIWSFKAHMTLAAAARISRQYDNVLQHYEKAMSIAKGGIDLTLAEALMLQFINDLSAIPAQYLMPVIDSTLSVATGRPELWKVRCAALLKRATSYLGAGDAAAAISDLSAVESWCQTDTTQTDDQHQVQLYSVLALQMWAYRLKKQYGALRLVYYHAIRSQPAFVSLTSLGDVHYEGGHMFLRDGDWYAAQRAFSSAFRAYSGAGNTRRLASLKYAALANMLGGAVVDTLSSSENKTVAESPELKPVTLLETAVVARSVPDVLSVLQNKSNAAVLQEDPLFAPYLDQLLYRLRLEVVGNYVQGFTSVRLERVAKHIAWDVANTAELCSVAIYHGLNASLDAMDGVLYVYDSTATSEFARADELRQWATTATLS